MGDNYVRMRREKGEKRKWGSGEEAIGGGSEEEEQLMAAI